MEKHDRSRLPKWAQRELTRLERDLAHAEAKLSEGPADSDTFADPYADSPRPLGKSAIIEFKLGDGRIRVRTGRDHRGRSYIDVNGDDVVLIQPRASNAVWISVAKR